MGDTVPCTDDGIRRTIVERRKARGAGRFIHTKIQHEELGAPALECKRGDTPGHSTQGCPRSAKRCDGPFTALAASQEMVGPNIAPDLLGTDNQLDVFTSGGGVSAPC